MPQRMFEGSIESADVQFVNFAICRVCGLGIELSRSGSLLRAHFGLAGLVAHEVDLAALPATALEVQPMAFTRPQWALLMTSFKQIKHVACGFRNQANYERRIMLHSAALRAA